MKLVKKMIKQQKRFWVGLRINWIEKLSEPIWTGRFIYKK